MYISLSQELNVQGTFGISQHYIDLKLAKNRCNPCY